MGSFETLSARWGLSVGNPFARQRATSERNIGRHGRPIFWPAVPGFTHLVLRQEFDEL